MQHSQKRTFVKIVQTIQLNVFKTRDYQYSAVFGIIHNIQAL